MQWWLDWLDDREDELHTDAIVDLVDEFHDNLRAALDTGVETPESGLRLLRWLSRPWHNSGRHVDAMAAVDRLLTAENAERHPQEWMRAAVTAAVLVGTARGYEARNALSQPGSAGDEQGDDYCRTVAEWLSSTTPALSVSLRDIAHRNGQRYVEALAIILLGENEGDGDPASRPCARRLSRSRNAAGESSYLARFAAHVRALAALATGRLDACIDLARGLAGSRSMLMANSAIELLSDAALLRRDADALGFAVEFADRHLRKTANTARTADIAAHRMELLAGGASTVPDDLRRGQLLALDVCPLLAGPGGDRRGWLRRRELGRLDRRPPECTRPGCRRRDRCCDHRHRGQVARGTGLAVEHDLEIVAVDAIEGLAVSAAAAESWADCLRLTAAAARRREETGYGWRFGYEAARSKQPSPPRAMHWDPTSRIPPGPKAVIWSGTKRPPTHNAHEVNGNVLDTAGPASRQPSLESWRSLPKDSPTRRSPSGC